MIILHPTTTAPPGALLDNNTTAPVVWHAALSPGDWDELGRLLGSLLFGLACNIDDADEATRRRLLAEGLLDDGDGWLTVTPAGIADLLSWRRACAEAREAVAR